MQLQSESLVVGAVLAGALAVSVALPIGVYASGLLVVGCVLAGGIAVVPGAWPTLYRTTGIGAGAWLLGAGVAVGGVALTYLVGDPRPFCEGIGYRGCLSTYGYASTAFLAGSLGIAIAAGHLGRYRRLRDASVGPASDVDEGLAAVEGRVVPAGGTVTGPVSGQDVAWYRSAVERPALFRGHLEADRETGGGEFYVADGSGRLLVLPDGFDAHDVAELARSHTATDGDRRRREWSYQPDDAVTVVGRVTDVSRAEYPEPFAVGVEGPVLVGRGQLTDLRRWAARRAIVGGVLGVGIGGAALLVMVLTA